METFQKYGNLQKYNYGLLLSFSVGFGQTKSIEVSDLSFLKPKPFNFVKSTNKLPKVDTKFIQFLYIKTVCLDLSMQKKEAVWKKHFNLSVADILRYY